MIKHIIIWTLKKEFESEKDRIKAEAKEALEGLVGKVEGLVSLKLEIDMLPSSSGEMLLVSELKDKESLELYRVSPIHNAVADKYVRPYTDTRLACDFEV